MSRSQKVVQLNSAQDAKPHIADPVFAAFKELLVIRSSSSGGSYPEKKVDDDRPTRCMLLTERESLLERIVLETEATTSAGLLAQAVLLEEVNADLQSENDWTDPTYVEKLVRRQRFAIFSLMNGLSALAGIDRQSLTVWEERKDRLDDPHALCRAVAEGVAFKEKAA